MDWFAALMALPGIVLLIGTALDAARRRRNWFVWTLPLVFFGLFGVIPWLITHRRTPVVDRLGRGQVVALSLSVMALVVMRIITAVFVTTFLAQVARIEGGAMAPTLNEQDRVLVNKLAYHMGKPALDDIVMFWYPLRPERSFVKRIVGREGDQVRIVKGVVYVNDQLRDERFVLDEFRSHDTWGPRVVPEGYYFVLGDHRTNSSDSRHWGFVPTKYIVGKVQWRWWPIGAARSY